jgi:hypothetical protein
MTTTINHKHACQIFDISPDFLYTVSEKNVNDIYFGLIDNATTYSEQKKLIDARKLVLDAIKNPAVLIPIPDGVIVCKFGDNCWYNKTKTCRNYHHPIEMAMPNLPPKTGSTKPNLSTTEGSVKHPPSYESYRSASKVSFDDNSINNVHLNISDIFEQNFDFNTNHPIPNKKCSIGDACKKKHCKLMHRFTKEEILPCGKKIFMKVERYNI